jgi:DNA-binding transcriptional regulator YhcF (GntR family)
MTKPDYTLRSVFLYSYPQHAGDSAMHAGSSGNARAPFIFSLLKGTIALSGIVKQTYSEQVVEYIKDRILKGELSPGDPVKEALIAQKLAISRAPVREALQILAREGLIVYEPQKGKRITALTAKEIRDSYFTGGVLEAAAVAAALPLYTAQDIDLMPHERSGRHRCAAGQHDGTGQHLSRNPFLTRGQSAAGRALPPVLSGHIQISAVQALDQTVFSTGSLSAPQSGV